MTPMRLLNAYADSMPRLHAEQQVRTASAFSVGQGGKEAQGILNGWLETARGNDGEERGDRLRDFDLLAAMRDANERARADGTLWELQPAGVEG